MDHIAYRLCLAWSEEIGQHPQGLRTRFSEAALDYHRERTQGAANERHRKQQVYRERSRGVKAAKKWYELLLESTNDASAARDAFLASSLSWNVAGLREKRGQRLVSLMHATDSSHDQVAETTKSAVLEILDKYVNTNDYEAILDGLLSVRYS